MNDRQFSGLSDAGLRALRTNSDVSATFSLFYAHGLKGSEICLFGTRKMASSNFGGTRETGEPGQWPGFFLLRARKTRFRQCRSFSRTGGKLAALPVNRDDEPEGTAAEPSQSKTDLAQGGGPCAGLGAESAR